jgi:hypothetical protein
MMVVERDGSRPKTWALLLYSLGLLLLLGGTAGIAAALTFSLEGRKRLAPAAKPNRLWEANAD